MMMRNGVLRESHFLTINLNALECSHCTLWLDWGEIYCKFDLRILIWGGFICFLDVRHACGKSLGIDEEIFRRRERDENFQTDQNLEKHKKAD